MSAPRITVKFWRDIPSMVTVGRGRQAGKAQLSERFEQAIDRCAMRSSAQDEDAYLAAWRNEDRGEAALKGGDDAQSVAERIAAALEVEYDRDRLMALIRNDGRRED